MNLLYLTGNKFNIHPAQLFKEALNYAEVRMHPTRMRNYYFKCSKKQKFPQCVEDYCLDLLSGKTKGGSSENKTP